MIIKALSLVFLGLGVFVLMQVVMPVLDFKAKEVTTIDVKQLLADPRPQGEAGVLGYSKILGISIENINDFPAFISGLERDGGATPYKEFFINIPSINLSRTKVIVDSNDFEENLALLKGSALPGEKGNSFITGHSAIFSALDQKALFANLPNVKKNDQFFVEALGQSFVYEVVSIKTVDPKDVSVIFPPDKEGRYMSLMTCVPPGFNTKRLVVLAKLI